MEKKHTLGHGGMSIPICSDMRNSKSLYLGHGMTPCLFLRRWWGQSCRCGNSTVVNLPEVLVAFAHTYTNTRIQMTQMVLRPLARTKCVTVTQKRDANEASRKNVLKEDQGRYLFLFKGGYKLFTRKAVNTITAGIPIKTSADENPDHLFLKSNSFIYILQSLLKLQCVYLLQATSRV